MTSSQYSNPTRKVNLDLKKLNRSKVKGKVEYTKNVKRDSGSFITAEDPNKKFIDERYKPRQETTTKNNNLFGKFNAKINKDVGLGAFVNRSNTKIDKTKSDVYGSWTDTDLSVQSDTVGLNFNFPISEAKASMSGSQTNTKGQGTEEGMETFFRTIQNNVGASIGAELTNNLRADVSLNRNWIKGSGKSTNTVGVNIDKIFRNGSTVTASLSSSDKARTPVGQLTWKIPLTTLMKLGK